MTFQLLSQQMGNFVDGNAASGSQYNFNLPFLLNTTIIFFLCLHPIFASLTILKSAVLDEYKLDQICKAFVAKIDRESTFYQKAYLRLIVDQS